MTIEELRSNLSQNIKNLRRKYSLTQEKLAEKTGLSAQTINDIEGCRSWVSDKSIIRIAESLETSPSALLLPPEFSKNSSDYSETLIAFAELKKNLKDVIDKTFDEKIIDIRNKM